MEPMPSASQIGARLKARSSPEGLLRCSCGSAGRKIATMAMVVMAMMPTRAKA